MHERRDHRVQNVVQVFTGILRQKAQDEIAMLLQQGIFPPVPPVRSIILPSLPLPPP
jgi:hypothetical protein